MLRYIHFLFISLLIFFSPEGIFAGPVKDMVPVPEERQVSGKILNSSEEAEQIIQAIMNSVGLKANFEIKEADISNAAAVIHKGKRLILYDPSFIRKIQLASKTDWAAVSILAHEIGHHLNGHTMMSKGEREPALELEADEFSGFILRQMGAPLEDALKGMRLISHEKGSHSHPAQKARLAAIERGYIAANERILAFSTQTVAPITASYQYDEEEIVEQPVFAFTDEHIYKKVYLKKFPDRTFYLTKDLKLVVLNDKGTTEIGNLAKNRGKIVLNLYGRNRDSRLYVSKKGMLVDGSNRVVGYLEDRS